MVIEAQCSLGCNTTVFHNAHIQRECLFCTMNFQAFLIYCACIWWWKYTTISTSSNNDSQFLRRMKIRKVKIGQFGEFNLRSSLYFACEWLALTLIIFKVSKQGIEDFPLWLDFGAKSVMTSRGICKIFPELAARPPDSWKKIPFCKYRVIEWKQEVN